MPIRLFISYARSDSNVVYAHYDVYKQKITNSDSLFIDKEIRVGELWWNEILDQIQGCSHFLFCASEASLKSPYCERELDWAVETKRNIAYFFIDQSIPHVVLPDRLYNLQGLKNGDWTSVYQWFKDRPTSPSVPDVLAVRPECPKHPAQEINQLIEKHRAMNQTIETSVFLDMFTQIRDRMRNDRETKIWLSLLKKLRNVAPNNNRKLDIEELINYYAERNTVKTQIPQATARASRTTRMREIQMTNLYINRRGVNTSHLTANEISELIQSLPSDAQTFFALSEEIHSYIGELSDDEKKKLGDSFSPELHNMKPLRMAAILAGNHKLLEKVLAREIFINHHFLMQVQQSCRRIASLQSA